MADSNAVITLGATDAAEMLVSERADFGDASWQPVASSLPWTFHGDPGARAIFARFRDAQQQECAAVFDGTRQTGAATGDLLVQADSTGAQIWLDGARVSGGTDLLVSGLEPGPYAASVTYPAHQPAPSFQVADVQDGQQAQVSFTLTPRQVPDPFDLIAPADSVVLEDLPDGFLWRSTADPDPVSAVSYGLEVSADSSFATHALEVAGLSDTLFVPFEGYADSTRLYWRAPATTVYGAERLSDRRSFWIDRTAPTALVLSPNGGESWVAGTNDTIRWQAEDWSGVDSVSLALSLDGGQTYTPIVTPLPGDSMAVYAVPDTFATNQTTCRIRVEAFDRAGHLGADETDGDFEILGPALLSGTVRNAQLAPIPLATIEAYADTGLVATTASDSTGAYSMNLPAATYEVRASATDYLLEIQADVVVSPGSETVLDLTLGRLLVGRLHPCPRPLHRLGLRDRPDDRLGVGAGLGGLGRPRLVGGRWRLLERPRERPTGDRFVPLDAVRDPRQQHRDSPSAVHRHQRRWRHLGSGCGPVVRPAPLDRPAAEAGTPRVRLAGWSGGDGALAGGVRPGHFERLRGSVDPEPLHRRRGAVSAALGRGLVLIGGGRLVSLAPRRWTRSMLRCSSGTARSCSVS